MGEVTPVPVLVFNADGTCHMDFGEFNHGFREPICPMCGEPIQWCLDMFSFQTGRFPQRLCHARCAWKPEAFTRERRLSAARDKNDNHG